MNIKILALFVEMVNIAYRNKDNDKSVYVKYNTNTNSIDVTYINNRINSTDYTYLDWQYSDTERIIKRCKKIKNRMNDFFEGAI